MKDTDKVANRLALLEGINLSPADLESIVTEIKDLAGRDSRVRRAGPRRAPRV
jgi:hypothetical protein